MSDSSEDLKHVLITNGLKDLEKWLPILRDIGIETTDELDLLIIESIKKFATTEAEISSFKTIQLRVELEKAGLKPSYWIGPFKRVLKVESVEALKKLDSASYKALEPLADYKGDKDKLKSMFERIELERESVGVTPDSSVTSSYDVINVNQGAHESSAENLPSNLEDSFEVIESYNSSTQNGELKHEDANPDLTSQNEGSSKSPETGEIIKPEKSSCKDEKESKQWQEMEESGYVAMEAGKTSNDDSAKQENENKDSLQHAISKESTFHENNHDQTDINDVHDGISSDQIPVELITGYESQSKGRSDCKHSDVEWSNGNESDHPLSDILSDEKGDSLSESQKATRQLEPRKNVADNAENKPSSEHEDSSPEMTSQNEGSSKSPETGKPEKYSRKESKQWKEIEEPGYVEAAGKTSNDDSVKHEKNKDSLQHAVSKENISHDSSHDQNDTPISSDQTHATRSDSLCNNGRSDGKHSEMKCVMSANESDNPLSDKHSDGNGNSFSESQKVVSQLESRNNGAENKPSSDKCEFIIILLYINGT